MPSGDSASGVDDPLGRRGLGRRRRRRVVGHIEEERAIAAEDAVAKAMEEESAAYVAHDRVGAGPRRILGELPRSAAAGSARGDDSRGGA